MSFSVGESITIPSPIDVHTHLREPGGAHKETIESGTYAALHGGYCAVFDMPNNPGGMETHTESRLDQKSKIALETAHTNIGFYAGVDLDNPQFQQFAGMIRKAAGIKLYMGHTTGTVMEHDLDVARPSIDRWIEESTHIKGEPPILLHAREEVGEETARYIASQGYPVHWCHISTLSEVRAVQKLSQEYPDSFSAGVTPHHLTMTQRDADFKYGWNGARMMPPLGLDVDGDALLDAYNKGDIKILETDHAPHTSAEKVRAESENPEGYSGVDCTTCFGISGIEFVLPIMMSLVQRKKITIDRLVDSLHTQPARMLGLIASEQTAQTTMQVEPYILDESDRMGKSKNNPYVGWTAWATVTGVRVDGVQRLSRAESNQANNVRILRTGAAV